MTYVILGIVVLIAVLAVAVAMQPHNFRYERSTVISAPAHVVFAQVNDFHKWEAWSPWEKVDPNVKRTYGGSISGVGATYAWQGNKQLGSGNMLITESRENELVRIRLEFTAPMKAVNTTDFALIAQGSSTTLTQAMYGKNTLMGKIFGLFMNMEKMIGPQFEKGLADIKKISEASAQ
jgi:Polyketide cyclase / dehydrase and lipid transport